MNPSYAGTYPVSLAPDSLLVKAFVPQEKIRRIVQPMIFIDQVSVYATKPKAIFNRSPLLER
jgi:hypothetical protein